MSHLAQELRKPLANAPWRNLASPHRSTLAELQSAEGYHRLDIEDCLHRREIAKVVERDSYTFVVAKVIRYEKHGDPIHFDDIDLFIRKDQIVSVEEHPGSFVTRVTKRLTAGNTTKQLSVVELLRAFAEEISAGYLAALDDVGARVGALEDRIVHEHSRQAVEHIFKIKRELIEFRRHASGMRDVVSALMRHPIVVAEKNVEPFFRDLYEDSVRAIEFIETYRDVLNGLFEIYATNVANHTNEVVKRLTAYGVIVLPLLIIPGLFGMNVLLPYEKNPHAFTLIVVLIALCTVAIVGILKRRGWF